MRRLYIFDFDGTITKKDSFILFTFYSVSIGKFIYFWMKTLVLYSFLPKGRLKEGFFNYFRNNSSEKFNAMCNEFFEKKVKKTIKPSFIEFIKGIERENSVIEVVSASVENYLKPWCDEMSFNLISTELEIVDEKLTGRFSTPNCNGKEKVKRIKQKYNLSEYDEIHVFGNSKGDIPMLELGTHCYYNFFK